MEKHKALWETGNGVSFREDPIGGRRSLSPGQAGEGEVTIHGVGERRGVCGLMVEEGCAFPGVREAVDAFF